MENTGHSPMKSKRSHPSLFARAEPRQARRWFLRHRAPRPDPPHQISVFLASYRHEIFPAFSMENTGHSPMKSKRSRKQKPLTYSPCPRLGLRSDGPLLPSRPRARNRRKIGLGSSGSLKTSPRNHEAAQRDSRRHSDGIRRVGRQRGPLDRGWFISAIEDCRRALKRKK